MQELDGKEYEAVKTTKKMVALRMNPESERPSPGIPEGDDKVGFLVWATAS